MTMELAVKTEIEQAIAEIAPVVASPLPKLITETMMKQIDVLVGEIEERLAIATERHNELLRVGKLYIEDVKAKGLAMIAAIEKETTETASLIEEYQKRNAKLNGYAQ